MTQNKNQSMFIYWDADNLLAYAIYKFFLQADSNG